MKKRRLQILVPSIIAAAALALAVSVSGQTTPPPASPPAAKSAPAAPMAGHHMAGAAAVTPDADMKADCKAMMAKKQEAQDKLAAMDATLDKLVADMNAAKESKAADALEKPMAAVLNELVAQRKVMRSMMSEMQPAMMGHMAHHMHMQGAKGEMDCPMMKTGKAPELKAGETKP